MKNGCAAPSKPAKPPDVLRLDSLATAVRIGDIIRLAYNYDLGPGSSPVDLLVFQPVGGSQSGAGLVVASGYKSGLVYAILPAASVSKDAGGISAAWLKANWHLWFCHAWGEEMRVIPIDGSSVLRWEDRQLPEA